MSEGFRIWFGSFLINILAPYTYCSASILTTSSLSTPLVVRIYGHSQEKFRLATVKNRLHGIFHHYPLNRFTFIVNHIDGYISGELLFKHAVGATISSESADLFYLQDFKRLVKNNAANVNFKNMSHIEAMVKGPCEVALKDDEVEEMLGLAKHLLNREYRITTQLPSNNSRKRFRTPLPVGDELDEELK